MSAFCRDRASLNGRNRGAKRSSWTSPTSVGFGSTVDWLLYGGNPQSGHSGRRGQGRHLAPSGRSAGRRSAAVRLGRWRPACNGPYHEKATRPLVCRSLLKISSFERQLHAECRAAAVAVFDPQRTTMGLNDCASDRQPHTHASWLGCEEGLEKSCGVTTTIVRRCASLDFP